MIAYLISLVWGIIIGLGSAIPVGPVGLVCIQRTLAKNKLSGIISGFGSATADATFATISAFSIRFIINFIQHHHVIFRSIGAIILIYIGIKSVLSKESTKITRTKSSTAITHIEEFVSGFAMTITNPLTAIVFLAGFASINKIVGHSATISTLFVIGVFIGSCIWWQILTFLTDKLAHKIKGDYIDLINKTFSFIIVIIGLILLSSVLLRYIDII